MDAITQIYQFIIENKYLKFLAIVAISFLISVIARIILKRVLKPLALKTKTQIDDLIIKSISAVFFYIVFFIGLKLSIQHFKFESDTTVNLIDTALLLVVCLFLVRIIDNFARHWLKEWKDRTRTTADERVIPLLQKTLKAIVIILGVIFVFSVWGINISPLLTGAGIAGLTIGLAVKDSLSNIFGGFQLVLDKTFKVGDKIQLDSTETGVILDIGLRSTKLKTYDNEVIYIPNGILANSKLKNFTQPDFSIRVNVNFGVEYGVDTEKVRQVVLGAVEKIEGVLESPAPVVQFMNMSDFSLDFVARAWVQKYIEAYQMKLKMTETIYNALNEAGIGIPFPTHTVYTKPE